MRKQKRTKEDRKTSYVIECVMMIIEKSYRKKNLFCINVKLSAKLSFSQHFRFYINYRKLNVIIKRNRYFISLINEILIKI